MAQFTHAALLLLCDAVSIPSPLRSLTNIASVRSHVTDSGLKTCAWDKAWDNFRQRPSMTLALCGASDTRVSPLPLRWEGHAVKKAARLQTFLTTAKAIVAVWVEAQGC